MKITGSSAGVLKRDVSSREVVCGAKRPCLSLRKREICVLKTI
jgi:hypothetical protein